MRTAEFMPYLSIVIPAYNEVKKIGPTLSRIDSFLRTKSYDFEIIVIDDGIVDGTAP
jgi:dolichyl-phosphate beta-glucosyltransferase